jgi:Fe-S cluster biogenesis protein NfuA
MPDTELDELPARLEGLLDLLAATGDPAVSEAAEQLVAALVQLYGAGLNRVVGICEEAGGAQLVERLAADPLVAHLLLLHGLHPDDVDTRVQRALDRVRPYLGAHAGDIEYLGVDADRVAQLRLLGSCDGCAGSTATVHSAIERAVLEAAPEVVRVQVEGMVAAGTGHLIQIGIRCPDGLIEAVGS